MPRAKGATKSAARASTEQPNAAESKDESRRLKLTLERKSGQIHDFSATVGDRLVIGGDGQKPRAGVIDLPEGEVHVRVVAVGVPGSEYSVSVDLPGKADDFTFKSVLAASVQQVEFDV